MVSYKKMYESLVNESRKESETDFLCPICNNIIILCGSQIYCKDDNCNFNPTIMDLLNKLYERID